jgi:hypothetical protein
MIHDGGSSLSTQVLILLLLHKENIKFIHTSSNFFFGHESKRHLQVELLHVKQLQKKEKQQQHVAVVHDDLMIKHLQQDSRIISRDHHVPAGPTCTTQ